MAVIEERRITGTEEWGAIKSLSRTFLVSGLTPGVDVITQALNTSGVPADGSSPTEYPNLILSNRKASVLSNDSTCVRIVCEYQRRGRSFRVLSGWGGNPFSFTISGGLEDVTSDVDADGNQLTLSHTFPDEKSVLDRQVADYSGETLTLPVPITYSIPTVRVDARGIIETSWPTAIVTSWNARVNANYWLGGAPGTWRCGPVEISQQEQTDDREAWEFRFTFDYRFDGWDVETYLPDPRTGQPIADLVEGVGRKTFRVYPRRDFSIYLRA